MVLVAGCLGPSRQRDRSPAVAGFRFSWTNACWFNGASFTEGLGTLRPSTHGTAFRSTLRWWRFLLRHKERHYPTPEGWLFANPVTGRPYHQEEIQKTTFAKPGLLPGSAAGSAGTRSGTAIGRGWTKPGASHRPKGVDAPCQYPNDDEHLRQSHDDTKRQAHSKVVEMVFKPANRRKPADHRKRSRLLGVNGSLWYAQKPVQPIERIGCGGRI